jgi:hypothetical protein
LSHQPHARCRPLLDRWINLRMQVIAVSCFPANLPLYIVRTYC